jgi:hypothetical protein
MQLESRDQFVWGLSNGVNVLSIGGAFWMALAAWTLGASVLLVAAVPILLLSGILIWRGRILRRRAPGFSRASVRAAPKGSSIRRIGVTFQIVGTAQTFGIGLLVLLCWILHRTDLIWPLIGLVVSLHFLPLAWLFSVRPYYMLGVFGTGIAVTSLVTFSGGAKTVAVGLGLGLLMSGCALYLVANAAALADAALRHSQSSSGAPPPV